MQILVWFDDARGEPQCQLQGVTSTEVLTASLALKWLAVDLREGELRGVETPAGRKEGGVIESVHGAAVVQAGDVVLEVRWPNSDPHEVPDLDWMRCTAPTAGQVWAASALLDEVGRHQYRMRLTAERAARIHDEERAHAAIERVAGRTDLTRLGKA